MAHDTVDIVDPLITQLIDPNAEIEQLGTGFRFTEGPIWHPREQCLYFSDMPGDVRRRWTPHQGIVEVRRPSHKCNGMTLDEHGNLYVCEHATSLLVLETPAGERRVLASQWNGKGLNSPNDVVVRSDGSAFFSDPTYGRMPVFGVERAQELDFQGVYRVAPDGTLHLEANDFDQPNGLCFSPDERTLYVNDSTRAHIRAFDVAPDGALSRSRVFADAIGSGDYAEGVVDGMKCDEQGNVYVTGPRGIWVFTPGGRHLGVIRMPEVCANLNWGRTHWDELFCTCSTSVYRVRMKVRGSRVSYMRMTR